MKIFLALIAFIFITGGVFVGIELSKKDDPKIIKSYVESRGKKPIPQSIRGEIGNGI